MTPPAPLKASTSTILPCLSLSLSLSMPEVDLETRVGGRGGEDGKVACETLTGSREGAADPLPAKDGDLPAESFPVRIGDEINWSDLNAVYDRDDSTKGSTNPKSHQSNPLKSRSNSQRLSGNLKPKTPIIGLPGKIEYSGYLGRSVRRPPSGRIFPKKGAAARGGGRAAVVECEPTSPKVSCIGKVLSERERDRRRRAHRRQAAEEAEERGGGGGCWAGFVAVFRFCGGSGKRRGSAVECVEDSPVPPRGKLGTPRAAKMEAAKAEPLVLGGMKRFSSGRRPASWGGDADMELDGDVAWSGPLDREETCGRRSFSTLEGAERDRDRESAGSTSV